MSDSRMVIAGGQQPIVRIRNEHSHTLAAGWRLSSSTAEITGDLSNMDLAAVRSHLVELQRIAFLTGSEEAVHRNNAGLEGGCQ